MLLQNYLKDVNGVATIGSRSESSLLFDDESVEVFIGTFQDDFSQYLRDSRKYGNTSPIVRLKAEAFPRNLNGHSLLLIKKDFRWLVFMNEWKGS